MCKVFDLIIDRIFLRYAFIEEHVMYFLKQFATRSNVNENIEKWLSIPRFFLKFALLCGFQQAFVPTYDTLSISYV